MSGAGARLGHAAPPVTAGARRDARRLGPLPHELSGLVYTFRWRSTSCAAVPVYAENSAPALAFAGSTPLANLLDGGLLARRFLCSHPAPETTGDLIDVGSALRRSLGQGRPPAALGCRAFAPVRPGKLALDDLLRGHGQPLPQPPALGRNPAVPRLFRHNVAPLSQRRRFRA